MKKSILVVVPYKARDLEGLALVGYHLKNRFGCEVLFTNGYGLELKILKSSPDILVLDHLAWDFKVAQAKLAAGLGIKVVILPTEGLFQDEEGAVRRAGKLHKAADIPDKYLTWGDYPRRALIKQKLMTEEQVQIAGCPRFDFYREPYLSLMISKAELVEKLGFINPDAPLILWATNTPYASRNADVMLARQTQKAGKPSAEVKIHIEDHLIQFREHSNLIVNLARRHPEYNFVIKVHPAEWINSYLEICAANPNIKLAYNAPIREFIYHCDILLQRNCTTATEGWMLKKPVLNLEIGEAKRPVRAEYKIANHRVFGLEETDSAIKSYLEGMPVPHQQIVARERFIKDFYGEIDGKSAERCAAAINEILESPDYGVSRQAAKNELTRLRFKAWEKQEDARFINKLKDFCGVSRDSSLRFWTKYLRKEKEANADIFVAEPEITPPMIEEIYSKFADLEPQTMTTNREFQKKSTGGLKANFAGNV